MGICKAVIILGLDRLNLKHFTMGSEKLIFIDICTYQITARCELDVVLDIFATRLR